MFYPSNGKAIRAVVCQFRTLCRELDFYAKNGGRSMVVISKPLTVAASISAPQLDKDLAKLEQHIADSSFAMESPL